MLQKSDKKILLILLFIPVLFLNETTSSPLIENFSEQTDDAATEASIDPWRDGKIIIEAYHRAYPDKVAETAFRNEDWALRIGEQWFYWAGGKLLPEDALPDAGNYSRHPFYPYSRELPPLREFSASEIRALEQRVTQRASSGVGRHQGLPNALWNIHDRRSSEVQTKTLYLFGNPVNVHRDLLEDLSQVEERLLEEAQSDRELAAYIDSINSIAGYSWRNIASSSNRSMHAYGIAVDFLPRSYSQDQVYWLWARESGLTWYNLPYEKRSMPPLSFVYAFEDAGFIWGGKWLYFDTIHFEYRPEILLINGMNRN